MNTLLAYPAPAPTGPMHGSPLTALLFAAAIAAIGIAVTTRRRTHRRH